MGRWVSRANSALSHSFNHICRGCTRRIQGLLNPDLRDHQINCVRSLANSPLCPPSPSNLTHLHVSNLYPSFTNCALQCFHPLCNLQSRSRPTHPNNLTRRSSFQSTQSTRLLKSISRSSTLRLRHHWHCHRASLTRQSSTATSIDIVLNYF